MRAKIKFNAVLASTLFFSVVTHADKHGTQPHHSASQYSIVYSTKEDGKRVIYVSDEEGNSRRRVTNATLSDGYPSVSSDGSKLAFYGKYDGYKTWSIHTANMDGSNVQRLTREKHVWDSAPSWSADGKTIIFSREFEDAAGDWQEKVWLMNADGSGQRQVPGINGRAAQLMYDGRILFQSKTGPSQIFIADADGQNTIQLTDNDTNDRSPKLSPDGKHIVFLSNRDGNQEVYTMNVDGSEQKRMTFNQVEDWDPAWSADGSKILFVTANNSDYYDVFKMNRDGSGLEKVLDGGTQVSTFKRKRRAHSENLAKM